MSSSGKDGTSGEMKRGRRATKLPRAALEQRRQRALEHAASSAVPGTRPHVPLRAPREDRSLADEAAAQQQADQQQERPAVEDELLIPVRPWTAINARAAQPRKTRRARGVRMRCQCRATLTQVQCGTVKLRLSVAVVLLVFVAGCGGSRGFERQAASSRRRRRAALQGQLRQLPHARGRGRVRQGRPGPRLAQAGA